MNLCLKNNEVRRCRPLLGTFVEIVLEQDDDIQLHGAIDAAFVAVERVHQLMSFHDSTSEVSALNRLAAHQNVLVSLETYQVLKVAKELYEQTNGIFDITVATELLESGLLPKHTFLKKQNNYSGRTCDIKLLPGNFVRFLQPLCIDLGGIAKGFAVDKAVEILQCYGIKNGIVNAGGDLRCFGNKEQSVLVRHPQNPLQLLPLPAIKNLAFATSANSYKTMMHDQAVCTQFHGQTREALRRPFSVSVGADSCMIADALTKVVLALEKESVNILDKYSAIAYIIYPDNNIIYFEGRKI